ncbi:MAG TPA: hypothetical protein VLT33_13335, partial [Labilithrix sp.]|nr:hypothetical protein [Labilithrix sp.]
MKDDAAAMRFCAPAARRRVLRWYAAWTILRLDELTGDRRAVVSDESGDSMQDDGNSSPGERL